MNANVHYTIANPPSGHKVLNRTFVGEHFEVYSPPIRSKYSEVVWRNLDSVLLPEHIRKRYNNSVIAITGYELDVVRKTDKGTEVSVPCYESYNHHFQSWLIGRKASLSKTRRGPDMGHGPMPLFEVAAEEAAVADETPHIQAFNEHNGNEARQSFHGFPRGYVQALKSPETFLFNPMQINLRNPDGSGRRGGPLPRSSAAPPDAPYSGILECPCTTRVKKVLAGHMALAADQCGGTDKAGLRNGHFDAWDAHAAHGARNLPVASAAECFAAARELFPGTLVSENATGSSASLPPGCTLAPVPGAEVSFRAFFNSMENSSAPCGGAASGTRLRSRGSTSSLVVLSLDVDEASGIVQIEITGGDGKWFGVGFGAVQMSDLPYTIVVDGSGAVTERKLGNHEAGTLLQPSLRVVSSRVEAGQRTVVLQRPLVGRSADHFNFSARVGTIPFINALGGGASFGQHVARQPSSISLLLQEASAPTCVCRKAGGTIDGFNYDPQCPKWPKSDLGKRKNPMCDVSTYVGGMACCRDGTFLLDEDQEVPPYVDEVFYKWRFYYTDFDQRQHTETIHLEWALNGCCSGGSASVASPCRSIEYDVPQAPPGTPPGEAVHTVTANWQVHEMLARGCDVQSDAYCADLNKAEEAGGVQLIMAGGHCHAPACLSLELWDGDTGELLCRIAPTKGTGDAALDELGYLWLPPCQWGSAADGLRAPPLLRLDTNLTSVKRANSSVYHYGVMAIWQMRGVYAPRKFDWFV